MDQELKIIQRANDVTRVLSGLAGSSEWRADVMATILKV